MSWISGKRGEAEERMTGLEAELAAAKARGEALDRENRALRDQVGTLRRRLEAMTASTQDFWQGRPEAETSTGAFVEGHGVLWCKSAAGRVEPICYCPACRLVMTPLPSGFPTEIVCTRCKGKAPFPPEQLSSLVAELQDRLEG